MKTGFLILMGVVLACTLLFGFLIWKQTVKFEKKAMEAKKRKEAYLRQLEEEQQRLQEEASALNGQQEPQPEDEQQKREPD